MTPKAKLRARDVRQRFNAAVTQPDELIDLAQAALLIAAEEDTQVDVAHYLALIDEFGRAGAARVASQPGAGVEAFNQFMFEEKRFRGNLDEYYDPHNSFLHDVLDRRVGIPITLSIVYIAIGDRAGLETHGVGMPGHFIVRAREVGSLESSLVDPFDGRMIDRDDCQARLDELFEGNVVLTDEHLRKSGAREILVRLLTNLKAIYTSARLYRKALAVVERLLVLKPGDSAEQRDRGALLAHLDELPEAIWATQLYLQLSPQASDVDDVKEQLHIMQRQMAGRN
ncbi:MAG TPA: tetratricopeptide repeat protein [Pyrinomonadaceae bacterium]|nr:tetratricopeptide repeat protein [Pyrinomonadaceae bacterium]